MSISRLLTGVFLFAGLSGFGLLACTGLGFFGPEVSTDTCKSLDWFEAGRRDGLAGKSPRDNALLRQCQASSENTINAEAFEAGFNRGLVDYCTPERAFLAGRNGESYSGVCPAELEDEVVGAHLKGKRLAKRLAALEEENTQIEMQIEALLTADQPKSASGLIGELGALTGLGKDLSGGKANRGPQSNRPLTREEQLKLLKARRAELNLEIKKGELENASSSL